jgi:hypothetical protein
MSCRLHTWARHPNKDNACSAAEHNLINWVFQEIVNHINKLRNSASLLVDVCLTQADGRK